MDQNRKLRLPIIPVMRQFAAERECTVERLIGPCRRKETVALRRELIQLLHAHGYSASAIGRRMKRDHTTISHHLGRLKSGVPKRWVA